MDTPIEGEAALRLLIEGNARFAAGHSTAHQSIDQARLQALKDAQSPHSIILGCSDSRVPAEIVFDQGLGDLFVIRVAGNVIAPSLVGSVEFAAEQFGTRLVVVLGHTHCGAVKATVAEIESPNNEHSVNIGAIVGRIRPVVSALRDAGLDADPENFLNQSIRANVRASADHLRHGSASLETLIRDQGLLVVGAVYDIETGKVQFFDGLPNGIVADGRDAGSE